MVQRQQVVDHVEAPLARRIVDAAQVDQLPEQQSRLVAQEGQHPHDGVALDGFGSGSGSGRGRWSTSITAASTAIPVCTSVGRNRMTCNSAIGLIRKLFRRPDLNRKDRAVESECVVQLQATRLGVQRGVGEGEDGIVRHSRYPS